VEGWQYGNVLYDFAPNEFLRFVLESESQKVGYPVEATQF
jgi:hypothetical protein